MSIEKYAPVMQVLTTISNNVIINIIALKLYPFLKKKVETNAIIVCRGDLFENIKATFFNVSDLLFTKQIISTSRNGSN